MITLLLAFDFIAPMIGGVVLAGAFSFFGGVLLARRKPEELEISLGERFVPGLEAEIDRLNRERKRDLLEAEWLSDFANHGSITPALWVLLEQIVPQHSASFAAIVGVGKGSRCMTAARGLSKHSIEQFVISKELVLELKSENPLVVERKSDRYGLFENLDSADTKKTTTIHLTALEDAGEIFGVLATSKPWPDGFAEAEQRLFMKRVARKIGKRWRQMLVAEQQTNELRATQDMLDLRAIIDSRVDEPQLTLERFAKRLRESVNADRVAIYFVARRTGEKLQPVVQCGRSMPLGTEAIWNRHERTLATIAIDSEVGSLHDAEWLKTLHADSPITSAATMPIRVNGRVLGALCLTRQGYDGSLENSRKLIEFSAETLSQTLRRVFDEATIRRQAHHDHLTDLVNRRSFDAYLATEVERIQLAESPTCSLILADLDRFKSINDQYGHPAGDHVLREAARVLAEQVARMRTGERSIVARYGGEEFAILLPGVGLPGALRIAEGIRAAIEAEEIRFQSQLLKVTLSLGVAVCPDQANTSELLIAVADKALYQAKTSGRNRVCRPDEFVD